MARKQPESKIVKDILDALRRRGWFAWKVHTGKFSTIGVSDIHAVKDGRFASIEVKCPAKEPTQLQKRWIDDMRRFGCFAGVATSVNEALEIVGEN